ncbi:MAG: ATP-binding cassette domain-containing protein [Alicyclobacillus sp.]|nr:ATP-binding cassette domain-containing protein [Alicyclobacillus sp.]
MQEADHLAVESGTGRVFRRLMRYMKPYARTLVIAFVVLALATGADVLGPVLIQRFIDDDLTPRHFPTGPVLALAVAYLALQVGTAVFNYLQSVWFQEAALKMIQQLRMDVFGKVQHLGLKFFDRTPTGVLVSRITNDTEAIKDFYVSVMSSYVQNIFLLIGIFVSMFALDARLAGFCVLLAPIVVCIMWAYRRASRRIFHETRRRLSLLNAKLNESLQGMYLIQAMRQQARLKREFGAINTAYFRARMRNIRMNSLLLRPLVDVVNLSTLVLILSFFGLQSLRTVVDIGVLYAFVNYLDRFFEPVNDMMERLNVFQQAMVAGERVFQVLDQAELAPTQVAGWGNPRISHGKVEFDDVTFSYDGETDVLRHISFTAYPGQTVALVGHTGSGKSSIVNLLMRFYSVEHGHIRIDDVPLEAYSDNELRHQVGLVLQDPFLFVGTIADNIRLGNDALTDEDIVEAARFVQADPFIERLPEGYREPVRERGATLSGGQRQLISFARTMAFNPKILVLDEATASVDTETEEAIQSALARMRQGRTTIAIAHRLSTIQDADLILVLHHGEIVERGTHQELLAMEGLYHKMYLLQQGGRLAVR